ncbi:MAG TPA: NAD(P)H-dependent oxidoreductase, partial [Chthoniobacterales bacterium]|nr:NAD(P)H-dependent oxidoreductase [Chthoniobacterales bacterium]
MEIRARNGRHDSGVLLSWPAGADDPEIDLLRFALLAPFHSATVLRSFFSVERFRFDSRIRFFSARGRGDLRRRAFSRAARCAARLVFGETRKRADVETELIDIRTLPLRLDDAGEQIKIPEFSEKMKRADGLILVVPEYNHSFPGLLKHALDTNLEEYIHKAVGICGVSAGPFGGTRVIEHLLPVMRELGLVTTFTDVNFGNVGKLFTEDGQLQDQSFIR